MTFYNVPGAYNIAIEYSSPTFTVQGIGGRDLSTSNPGYIVLPSKSTGQLIRIPVTANQNFIDDSGASEIINNLFGLTTGVAAATDIPFCLYAVSNDNEDAIAFMISRRFGRTISPSAANIGAPDDAVADDFADFWSLESLDETLYDQNPCIPIGSFRMQMSSSDDWTVQTLNFYNDGIDRWQNEGLFQVPAGHFGAASGKYFSDEGGTAPGFTNNNFEYCVYPNGVVRLIFAFTVVNVAGVGAVDARLQSPFITNGGYSVGEYGAGFYYDNSVTDFQICNCAIANDTNDIRFINPTINTASYLENQDFDSSDQIYGSITYQT